MVKGTATDNGVIATDPLELLAIDDDQHETVYVPEWKKTVRVRSITAAEREDLLHGSVTVDGKVRKFDPPAMRVKIVCLAVVDENGARVFSSKHMVALGQKSAQAIDRIADVAMRLAGISDDTEDDEGKAPSSTPTSDLVTS